MRRMILTAPRRQWRGVFFTPEYPGTSRKFPPAGAPRLCDPCRPPMYAGREEGPLQEMRGGGIGLNAAVVGLAAFGLLTFWKCPPWLVVILAAAAGYAMG